MGWWVRAVGRAAGRFLRGRAGRGPPRCSLSRASASPPPPPPPPPVSELDKADAWLLRKAHETGFLSWFRNGLLATGIGVISYVQSDMGREAAYGFFILGGICVSYGSASYLVSLFRLRRTMMRAFSTALLNGTVVTTAALFWLCAVSLYIGRLEVEIIQEDRSDECQDTEKDDGKSDE
ncbi:transmembrane protein 160 isoform X1 [Dermochelys coriacea]|uniref:transmembrane protein 160 isoform X1 n=1 Tax=Dermochelys coriacea TaxID=27794 RepID=UPI0018E811FE|nr:transmembrane protein 160 isoform X1 [Dermochelys coriacea]